jgi:hypothetical protein
MMIASIGFNTLFKNKNPEFEAKTNQNEELKKIKFKTLEEQMSYVRNKSDLGKDFVFTVMKLFLFFVVFRLLLFPRITSFASGIALSIVVGASLSLFVSWYLLPRKFFVKNLFNGALNTSYLGALFSYVKFFNNYHALILIGSSLSLMILMSYAWKKIGGTKKW